jgi:hypothetical protein
MIQRMVRGFFEKPLLLARSIPSLRPIQRPGSASDVDALPGLGIGHESYVEIGISNLEWKGMKNLLQCQHLLFAETCKMRRKWYKIQKISKPILLDSW